MLSPEEFNHAIVDLVNFLVDVIKGKKEHPNFNKKDLVRAVKKQSEIGTFGLGFDTPSKEFSSSGKHFSKNSFGHLGFTGTSFWVDMEKNISIVLLSNRTHPDRDNNKLKKLRPLLHDIIMETLV